jgi:hypothetical protein
MLRTMKEAESFMDMRDLEECLKNTAKKLNLSTAQESTLNLDKN